MGGEENSLAGMVGGVRCQLSLEELADSLLCRRETEVLLQFMEDSHAVVGNDDCGVDRITVDPDMHLRSERMIHDIVDHFCEGIGPNALHIFGLILNDRRKVFLISVQIGIQIALAALQTKFILFAHKLILSAFNAANDALLDQLGDVTVYGVLVDVHRFRHGFGNTGILLRYLFQDIAQDSLLLFLRKLHTIASFRGKV